MTSTERVSHNSFRRPCLISKLDRNGYGEKEQGDSGGKIEQYGITGISSADNIRQAAIEDGKNEVERAHPVSQSFP